MAFDLKKYSAAARAQQIWLGKQYGSRDTLAQGNQTRKAAKKYATELAAEKFVAKDIDALEGACDGLIAAGVDRDAAKGEKLSTSKAYVDAMNEGQTMRLRARSALEGTLDDLGEIDTPEAAEGGRLITTVLRQTSASGEDAEARATQLDLLAGALAADGVKDAAKARGSEDLLNELAASAKALRAANAADTGVPGTPAETEALDQLDGIIVRLVRRARKAAVTASKRLGNPAIAREFRLDKLYRSRGGSWSDEGGDEGDDAADGNAGHEEAAAPPAPDADKGKGG